MAVRCSKGIVVWAAVLMLFLVVGVFGCGPCDDGEEFWQDITGIFPNLEISGQGDLYPASPAHFGYGFGPADPFWEKDLSFIREPETASVVVYGDMSIVLGEPWCDDGFPDQNLGCARIGMIQAVAGPKNLGEVYQVQHFSAATEPAEPPAIYLKWKEEKYYEGLGDFSEYRSVSVTGTAEVVDLEPFQMVYDVHFLDENGTPRDVKVGFLLGYTETCRAVD